MQVNKTYKVAISDENLVSRSGLCALVNDFDDFIVVDYSTSCADGGRERALDTMLFSAPTINKTICKEISEIIINKPGLPIIVLATRLGMVDQSELINLGISGLIYKEVTRLTLKESLLCVVHNGLYFPKAITELVLDNINSPIDRKLVNEVFSILQKEILQLLALGFTTAKVADKLCKSTRTI